jgi:sporadic carbohydrate cluster protein (TIGR04323 family)
MKNQKFKKIWHMGYIFSREIDNNIIPQKVQNLVIRDYAQRNKMNLLLSSTEYKMKNSYLMFDSLVNKKNTKFSGLIIYSLFMLKEYKDLKKIFNNLKKNNIRLFCALEEIELNNLNDSKYLKDTFFINRNNKNEKK